MPKRPDPNFSDTQLARVPAFLRVRGDQIVGIEDHKGNLLGMPVTSETSLSGLVLSTIKKLTAAEYAATAPKEPSTLYIIDSGAIYVGSQSISTGGGGGGGVNWTDAIDAGDTSTLNLAKTYADTKVTAEQAARDAAIVAGDTATLNSAKTYADTKVTAEQAARDAAIVAGDTATLNSSKTYTDSKVTAEQAARDAAIAAAIGNLDLSSLSTNYAAITSALAFLTPADVAFSVVIPFSGNKFMPQQAVTSVLAFTAGTNPAKGAKCYVRLQADGANAPTFAGMKEWGGSAGYDNRAGIVNEIEFWYDGVDFWYFINQAIGVSAVDTTAPTITSVNVANATPTVVTLQASEALDPGYVPAAAAFTVSGHTVSSVAVSGSTISLTVTAPFVNGEAARTVAYVQPASGQARDLAGNLLASFTGLAITNSVGVAAAAITLSGPTSGVVGSASTNFTVGVSPVGGTISGTVTVTPSDGGAGGTFTPTTVALTTANPSAAFTYTSAGAGTQTISVANSGSLTNPSSISYVSAAGGGSYPRFVNMSYMTESGTGPYSYTSTNSAQSYGTAGGVLNKAFQAGADGSVAITNNAGTPFIFGVMSGTSPVAFGSMPACIYTNVAGSNYSGFTNGAAITAVNAVAKQSGDIVRLRRVGSSLIGEVARAATPTTFTTIYTWTGISTGVLNVEVSVNSLTGTVSNPTATGLA